MKRIISLILVSLLTLSAFFCFAGCSVNKSEVAVLWSGEGEATNPNSLINSMDRAMYIANVDCTYYGAKGDASEQLKQAKTAIENGVQVLVVELINPLHAKEIVNAAKENNIPVVFFNCIIDSTLLNIFASYDKCFYIQSDVDSISDVQGQLIADYVKANFKKLDKDTDGKISYTFRGIDIITAGKKTIEKANALLATKDYVVKTKEGDKINTSIELTEVELLKSELILTDSDLSACEVLKKLQESDYNTDKLTTHFIPVFTVGEAVDYKDVVVAGRPALPENLVINEDDDDKTIKNKDKEIKKLTELMEYYNDNRFLVDLTVVNESDLDEMIYTTINVIDAGRLAGTVTENRDSMAIAVATVVKNICKGNETFKGVASDDVVIDGSTVKVRYIAYGN